MDRLHEWRIFVTVATLRSFAEASRALGVSPQAATRGVAALEKRLRTRLLHRTTRSVSVTSDGERYLERGRRAIAELEALEAPVDKSAPLRGVLTVTAPLLFGQMHVAPVVTEFLVAHPEVDVRLTLVDRVVSLADEGIDVAVRIAELADSSLRARLVGHVESLLVAGAKYVERAGTPRTHDDLAEHACIAFTATTPVVDRWSFPGRRTVMVKPRLVVNTGQAAIDAALAGVGIARVLSYQVGKLLEQGRLVELFRESDRVPVHLVQLGGIQTQIAQAFVELAAKRLPRSLDT
jgi:DNA-binding transcriptional LysR family regulator